MYYWFFHPTAIFLFVISSGFFPQDIVCAPSTYLNGAKVINILFFYKLKCVNYLRVFYKNLKKIGFFLTFLPSTGPLLLVIIVIMLH